MIDDTALPAPAERRPAKVIAFLQARMGSQRLPGKVLMKIRGRSILAHAVRRLRASPVLFDVGILTTTLTADDAVVDEGRRIGAPVYRGAAEDVLERYYEGARLLSPEIVIRATADNPLIDIGSVARIVAAMRAENLDYCMETGLPYGAATEAVTMAALERTHRLAREARHREHVTLYIKEHPEEFRIRLLEPPEELARPDFKVTVDTTEDFAAVKRIIELLPEAAAPRPLAEYIAAAEKVL